MNGRSGKAEDRVELRFEVFDIGLKLHVTLHNLARVKIWRHLAYRRDLPHRSQNTATNERSIMKSPPK